jgi:hypothetical protein
MYPCHEVENYLMTQISTLLSSAAVEEEKARAEEAYPLDHLPGTSIWKCSPLQCGQLEYIGG